MRQRGILVNIERAQATARPAALGDELLQHLDGLYRFALRLTRDAQLAQELAQESALRALERQSSIVSDLRAWLFQTLYHTFVSHYRRGLRREATRLDLANVATDRQELVCSLPEQILIEDVRSAIEALPWDLRTVVWLSDAEEFRLREIAEMLGWPLGTVGSRLWRARQELRRILASYAPEQGKNA